MSSPDTATAITTVWGIDVSKKFHHGAPLSQDLLARYKKYNRCPLTRITSDEDGFNKLLSAIQKYDNPANTGVLLENTGHYGFELEEFLQKHGITIYHIQPRTRYGRDKSDGDDAHALAAIGFNQIILGAQISDESLRIRKFIPPSATVQKLHGLVRHHSELSREITRRRNKLTAIADQLFPELRECFSDVNCASALNMRERYPTAQSVAQASIEDLMATREKKAHLYRENYERIQEQARISIGTKDAARIYSLCIEQQMLITEIRLHQQHKTELEKLITKIIKPTREGRILTSFIGIGVVGAATILSNIKSIAHFSTSGELKAYCGWGPKKTQTGTTKNSTSLDRGGNKLLKTTFAELANSAILHDPTWKALYDRLVERKCIKEMDRKIGTSKALGSVAGQMIRLIFLLLKRDYELISSLPEDAELPPPELYDPAKHCVQSEVSSNRRHITPPPADVAVESGKKKRGAVAAGTIREREELVQSH